MALNGLDKEELITLLKEVIVEVVEQHPLSDQEVQWVRMAIEAEARKASFRKAVIDKTLIGLMVSGLLWIGSKMVDLIMVHWK